MIYFKRGRWCVRDASGLHKFDSETEAMNYAGVQQEVEVVESDVETMEVSEEWTD